MNHRLLLLGFGLTACLAAAPVGAEVVTDGTTGQARSLTGPDYAITPDLGRQVGGNLFFSFTGFSLVAGDTATFSGPDSVDTIISRVTGGEPSSIDGLLRSTIPGADLYLLNPAGVIFGPHASLDLKGSFYVSTAPLLPLGEEGSFDALDPQASVLTADPPADFGFLGDEPAAITVNGASLAVPAGETITLAGGAIEVTAESTLTADEIIINSITAEELPISDPMVDEEVTLLNDDSLLGMEEEDSASLQGGEEEGACETVFIEDNPPLAESGPRSEVDPAFSQPDIQVYASWWHRINIFATGTLLTPSDIVPEGVTLTPSSLLLSKTANTGSVLTLVNNRPALPHGPLHPGETAISTATNNHSIPGKAIYTSVSNMNYEGHAQAPYGLPSGGNQPLASSGTEVSSTSSPTAIELPTVAKGAGKIDLDGFIRQRGMYDKDSTASDTSGRISYDSRVQLGVTAQVADLPTGPLVLEVGEPRVLSNPPATTAHSQATPPPSESEAATAESTTAALTPEAKKLQASPTPAPALVSTLPTIDLQGALYSIPQSASLPLGGAEPFAPLPSEVQGFTAEPPVAFGF